MSAFSIYKTDTGEFCRVIVGEESLAERNLREGEGYVKGRYRPAMWKVDLDSHEPIRKTPDT